MSQGKQSVIVTGPLNVCDRSIKVCDRENSVTVTGPLNYVTGKTKCYCYRSIKVCDRENSVTVTGPLKYVTGKTVLLLQVH